MCIFKYALKILRCVCVKCAKLLISKDDPATKGLRRLKGENRWKAVFAACQGVTRCGEKTEDGCGARQPTRYVDEDICRVVAEWKNLVSPAEASAGGAGGDDSGNVRRFLEPEYVYRLLRRISDEDVDFMGFSRYWCRPDWLMCTVLPIPPPQVRPSVLQDNNQRSEDDLTSKLIDIIKANNTLKTKISQDPKKRAIDEWTNLLQYHVATLVDNNIPGISPAAQRLAAGLSSTVAMPWYSPKRLAATLWSLNPPTTSRVCAVPLPTRCVRPLRRCAPAFKTFTFPPRAFWSMVSEEVLTM